MRQTAEPRSLDRDKRGVIRSGCMLGHRWHMDDLADPSIMFHMGNMMYACVWWATWGGRNSWYAEKMKVTSRGCCVYEKRLS